MSAAIADPNASPPGPRALPSWERLAAGVIDFFVLVIPEVILFVIIAGKRYAAIYSFAVAHKGAKNLANNPHFVKLADRLGADLFWVGIGVAALTAVYLIAMYLTAGATVGKLALGLRITRTDGRPMTGLSAFLRSVPFWVGSPFLFAPIGTWIWLLQFFGGTLVILFRPDHRGPEDFLGHTMVVRKVDQGRTLADLTSYRQPYIPPAQPPAAPAGRGGHLPGWGPGADQPPPPGGGSTEGTK